MANADAREWAALNAPTEHWESLCAVWEMGEEPPSELKRWLRSNASEYWARQILMELIDEEQG